MPKQKVASKKLWLLKMTATLHVNLSRCKQWKLTTVVRSIVLYISSAHQYFQTDATFNTGSRGEKKKVEVCNKKSSRSLYFDKRCIAQDIISDTLVNQKPCLFVWKYMA